MAAMEAAHLGLTVDKLVSMGVDVEVTLSSAAGVPVFKILLRSCKA
jgi:hypothetical protein